MSNTVVYYNKRFSFKLFLGFYFFVNHQFLQKENVPLYYFTALNNNLQLLFIELCYVKSVSTKNIQFQLYTYLNCT